MASSPGVPASARRPAATGRPRDAARRALTPSEAAWAALLPCTLLALAIVAMLGPAFGHAFFAPDGERELWGTLNADPQPAQHGRFLLGLLGPPLLVAATLVSATPAVRERLRLTPRAIHRLVLGSQLALVAFVVLCFLVQNRIAGLSADFSFWPHASYFRWRTLLVAIALPLALLALARRRDGEAGRAALRRLAAVARETPRRRVALAALAVAYLALWLLTAINLDSSIGNTESAVSGHLLWTMGEPFAVLNGRTPLVDFHAQYGQLWAYAAAGTMSVLGATIATYTVTMALGTGLAMLAGYAVLRRVTRSSALALALFVALVATAFFTIVGTPGDRYTPANLYIQWPIRFAGPFLMLWLTARHIDGARPRRAWPLFVVNALVIVNNPDYGIASCGGTLAALLCARPPRSLPAAAQLAGAAVAGLLGGIGLVVLGTLVRSGSLPDFSLLLEFARLYGIEGWDQWPMPTLGLHLAIFLTFAAALVVAGARVAAGARDRLLTGLLAWCGLSGLLTTVYWAGRAHPMALFDYFAPWALTVVLLLLVVVPRLAARDWRAGPPELAVLFCAGLMVCSLAQLPAPWSQVQRLRDATPTPAFEQQAARDLVADGTEPGEAVLLLMPLGHRVAHDTGTVNVSPYTSMESIATRAMLHDAIAALRAAGGTQLYLATEFTFPEQQQALADAGFAVRRTSLDGRFVELVDLRAVR